MAKTMKALMYDKAGRENSSVRQIPYPECGDDEIIIKVMSCSICKGAEHDHDNGKGTDLAKYPVVPGHEFAGYVHEVGKNVTALSAGKTPDDSAICYLYGGRTVFVRQYFHVAAVLYKAG